METITLHTNEYLRAHSSNEGISLATLSKKFGRVLEHMATGAVIMLVVSLVTVACIKVGQSGIVCAHYCEASTKMVFAP